jgi:septum formation protein
MQPIMLPPNEGFDLVLASTSKYRRELLGRLGVHFRAIAPVCDESVYKGLGHPPELLAAILAKTKARSVAGRERDATIIGSDQICAVGNETLSKPGTPERAVEQLLKLRGKEHVLITAVTILHKTKEWHHVDITRLTMRALSESQIERYVANDRPLDCAGAYKLEARGIALFDKVESADHSAITGLPLLWVARVLAEIGYELP